MDSDVPMFTLSRHVEDVFAVVPPPGSALELDLLPDGRTTLVFRELEGGRGELWVNGPRTRALVKKATGLARAVMFQFKPGHSAPLLGVAAHTLTDQKVQLEDLWGHAASELAQDLLAAPGLTDMMDRLSRAFSSRVPPTFEPASARIARQAVRLIEGGELRVDHVAERLGVTPRHLRRVFTESIGVAPKEFARSVRLQRAVQSAAASPDWARIAAESGYYDQAHLISDFRDLVGLTPAAFLRREVARRAAGTAAA
jgi:AraC-like DNA-binding protein